jgi:hypothetical protein
MPALSKNEIRFLTQNPLPHAKPASGHGNFVRVPFAFLNSTDFIDRIAAI